ncbi:MAG: 4-(cytidine 5'-diphospho)-2-C-methyl-D-erythritol kinase [Ignavibacteriaceae bacterium]
MDKIEIKTPAKINFGLNVVEKRADGFHNIETIFYPVKLFDKLTITKSDRNSFSCNLKTLPTDGDNLVLKAKEILEKESGKKFSLQIELEKNIPVGAGLGGGSSDAATVLHAINSLFNLDLSKEDLKRFALELGSDVPYFLDARPSFASGRGEILKVLDLTIDYPILIVNPGIHISTKWAYQNIRPKKPAKSLNEIFQSTEIDVSKFVGVVRNDFEEVVFKNYPEIEQIKQEMYKLGAGFSLMTGSGSTVFGIFPDKGKAKEAEIKFRAKYFTFLQS